MRYTCEEAIARLRSIERYAAGWDGERAAAPRQSAVNDAVALLTTLAEDGFFSVAPEPDGSIELSIQSGNHRAVLVFEGDGVINIYG